MRTHSVPTLATAALLSVPLMLAACASPPAAGAEANAASSAPSVPAGATAASTAAADPRQGDAVRRVCFVSSIDGFGETDRNSVIIEARRNQHYRIETFGGCFELDHAQTIGFDTVGGSNCLSKGDRLIASDSLLGIGGGAGVRPQRCTIREIYAWNPDAGQDEPGQDASGSGDTGQEADT
ncbi:MAG: DUF6491 family protein [Pseudomonadota bacterium]